MTERDIIYVGAPPRIMAREIIASVAQSHGFTTAELTGPARTFDIAHARQEAMWRVRQGTGLSLPHIGRLLGGRDHTTVLHGVRQHAKRMAEKAGAQC